MIKGSAAIGVRHEKSLKPIEEVVKSGGNWGLSSSKESFSGN